MNNINPQNDNQIKAQVTNSGEGFPMSNPPNIHEIETSYGCLSNLNVYLLIFAGLIAIAIAVVALLSNREGNKLKEAQKAELRRKDDELTIALKNKDIQIEAAKAVAEKAKVDAATANERVADATQKAAEANARAEEAKLELAKFRVQRGLTKEQRAKIVADLKEFSETSFDISGSSNETLLFALAITDTLTEAGWYIRSWTGGGIVRNLPTRKFFAGDVVTTGVHIQIFDPGLSKAKDALVKALKNAGFDGIGGTFEKVPPEHPSRHVMHINVGPKP